MDQEKNIPTFWMVIAVIGAFVSVAGICLVMSGLLLIEHDVLWTGLGLIAGGTATYVTILNWPSTPSS